MKAEGASDFGEGLSIEKSIMHYLYKTEIKIQLCITETFKLDTRQRRNVRYRNDNCRLTA